MNVKQRFVKFLVAREEMRLRKEAGQRSYSLDPILQRHRFCNINREHDTVTKWIHTHIRERFAEEGKDFMVRQLLFARIFNEPETLAVALPIRDYAKAEVRLKAHRAAGHKLFRGVYMMPTHGSGGKGQDPIEYYLRVIKSATQGKDYESHDKLIESASEMMTAVSVGTFLANQVCTDLRYVPGWGEMYEDWETFVLCGPGTRRGLNRYYGRELTASGSDEQFTEQILTIREHIDGLISDGIREHFKDPNNLSNSMCEFDKFLRAHGQASRGERITLRYYGRK